MFSISVYLALNNIIIIISRYQSGVNLTAYKRSLKWYDNSESEAIIKTSFTLRLNLIDHAKIKKIAESQNRSMTNMIETLVKEKIKEYEKENGEIELTDEDIIGE